MAPESDEARDWHGRARGYFAQLDARTSSFYLAAHALHRWNRELAERVVQTSPQSHRTVEVEGVPFSYVSSPQHAARLAAAGITMPYTRYEFVDGAPHARDSQRTTPSRPTSPCCR